MAYCRFSEGDIYLYPSAIGLVCCACRLAPLVKTAFSEDCTQCQGNGCESCMMHDTVAGMTAVEAIWHVCVHRAAGHAVPDDVIERLLPAAASQPRLKGAALRTRQRLPA